MARKIVVTGGKGGVGKTTLAVWLGAQLAQKGQRVLVFDADFGMNNVDLAAGVEQLAIYDIVDVIEGKCRAKQALIKHPQRGNLHILTSTRSSPERYVSPQAVKVVLDGLSPSFDFILIDCPAGLGEEFHRAVAVADEAIVVTTPTASALRAADKAVSLLKSYHLVELYLIVNRVRGDLLAEGQGISPGEIAELLKLPLLGILPETDEIAFADLEKIHPSIRMIAACLLTGKRKLFDVTKRYAGVWGNLRRIVKKHA